MGSKKDRQPEHGCSSCFEVDKGYYKVSSGQKVCVMCGGMVLNLQEAFDKLAELQADIDHLKEYYNDL